MVEERILIVDDNVEMLDKTSELLSHVGYSVVTCTSGEEALERLEHERVDLVLLDINMPSLNGFEVCLRIRQMYALDDLVCLGLCRLVHSLSGYGEKCLLGPQRGDPFEFTVHPREAER